MVQIRRFKVFKPRYAVTDSHGFVSEWSGRFGREGASGVLDGETYVFRKEGGKRFVLTAGDRELASADRAARSGRKWSVSVGATSFELVKTSAWRSKFDLRAGESALGTVSRKRRNTLCDLPDEVSTPVQVFLGFVAMALWGREAAGASAGTTGAVAAGV